MTTTTTTPTTTPTPTSTSMDRKIRMRPRELLAFTLTLALAPQLAHADPEADRLFKEGQRLLTEGRVAEACDDFAASDARDDRVGTLLNLGDCREQNNQIATAWATFLRAAALAQKSTKERKRAEEARRRAGYLQPRLSYLTISVPDASDVDGLTVTRDGAPVDRAYWNQGVPVDGGTYVIEAGAPGHDPWRKQVVVAPENAKALVDVPRFSPIEDLLPAVDPKPPAPHRDARPTPTHDDVAIEHHATPHRALLSPMRYGALGLGVVALGGIALGIVDGLAASREAAAITPDDPTYAADKAVVDRHSTISNLSFAGAALAAAGAVTLWIVGKPALPEHLTLAPDVGAGHASLSLALEF
jgi:hypothetical protein